jgi:hypothetical protein
MRNDPCLKKSILIAVFFGRRGHDDCSCPVQWHQFRESTVAVHARDSALQELVLTYPNTIVQLPRFEASVLMHSAHTNESGVRRMKTSQEHTMAQTSATATRGQVGAIKVARCKVGGNMPETAIRLKYKAVRSATSTLAASISVEDQMVQSCPEASAGDAAVHWVRAFKTKGYLCRARKQQS